MPHKRHSHPCRLLIRRQVSTAHNDTNDSSELGIGTRHQLTVKWTKVNAAREALSSVQAAYSSGELRALCVSMGIRNKLLIAKQ